MLGVIIVNVFAAVWAVCGLAQTRLPIWVVGLPILASAVIAGLCSYMLRGAQQTLTRPGDGRLIATWTAAEIVAIVVVANVLGNTGHTGQIAPAVAIVVGLHFLPLARGMGAVFFATAAALVSLGVAGMTAPATIRGLLVGLGAASVLWITALVRTAQRRHVGGPRSTQGTPEASSP